MQAQYVVQEWRIMYRMKHRIRLRGNLKTYLRWPLFFGLLFILMTVQLFSVSVKAGIMGVFYTVIYLLIAFLINFSGRRKLKKDLIEFATNYGEMQMRMMKTLTVPFAILSDDGHMLWGNDEFVSVIVNKKAARRNIANIFEEITIDSLPDSDEIKVIHVKTEDKYYRAVMKLIVSDSPDDDEMVKTDINQLMDNSRLISVFLYDETDMMELEQKRDAISKKLEKDKFLFLFKQSYLAEICSNRFAILEEIRDINLGNESSATISIGIGVGRDTFVERYDLARAAIDLALGRGGDQAVVKSVDQEKFYGGKSVQIERNTRVKARVKAHALKELIEGKERVVVMGHSIGDVDSFGASIGIYRIAKTLNRKANVVLNEVNQSVKPIRDRFYTKEYEGDMIVTGDEAKELVDENTVLVIVDVNRASYTECPELIEQAQSVVVIDHHRQAGDAIDKAVLFYIEPYASSASEMVAEISQYIGNGLKLKSAEAEAMYAGIMIDTNYFSNKTGVRTFEAMAYLRRNGADAVRIRKAFREDIDEYKIRAAAIQDTELYKDAFAIAESKSEGIESPTVFASKIANSLLDINGVKASFVLTKYRGKVYISARSIDEVNVQIMMEQFGGGGHINMAGAQLENVEVEAVKDMIREEIDRMIEEGEI